MTSIGRITGRGFETDWEHIGERVVGAVALLHNLEQYVHTLAANVHQVFTRPFDAVHSNLGMYIGMNI